MAGKGKAGMGPGFDPLAAVLGQERLAEAESATPEVAVPPAPSGKKPASSGKGVRRVRYPVSLPEDLVERLKRAAYHTRRPLSRIMREGIEARLAELEATLGGKPFPPIPSGEELPRGKPLGA